MIKYHCANCNAPIDKGIPDDHWVTVNRSSYYYRDEKGNEKQAPSKKVLLCSRCAHQLQLGEKIYYSRIGKFIK